MKRQDTYPIDIAGVRRELRLFEVKPGMRIAILNILGDVELVDACTEALADRLEGIDYDVIMTAETKSVPIAHMLARRVKKPYVVLRKEHKAYMGSGVQFDSISITTGKEQHLILDEKDLQTIKDHKVLIVDDVISTGSTLQAMCRVVEKAGGQVVREAAILTEGDEEKWSSVVSLGHLPVFWD